MASPFKTTDNTALKCYKKSLQKTQTQQMRDLYPDIPDCIWDIEPSEEMAQMYYDGMMAC